MVKIAGGTSDSISDLKQDLEKKFTGTLWIKSIPKDTGIEVRFLTEPEDWFKYGEHYSDTAGYFPCIGDGCPGCASDNERTKRKSRRWLANAVDVDSGFVIPLKLPLDCVNKLIQRYERHGGTIMGRNYKLFRYGTGLDTTYDVESEPETPFPFDAHEKIDLYEVLAESFAESFGDDGDSTPDEDTPSLDLSKAKEKKREREEQERQQARLEAANQQEPEWAEDDSPDEDEYLTEEDLHRMTKEELLVIADNLEVEVSMTMKKQEMIDTIIEEA